MGDLLMLGEVSRRTGIPVWCLDRLATRGRIRVERVGRYRCVRADALDDVCRAARESGYLPVEEPALT